MYVSLVRYMRSQISVYGRWRSLQERKIALVDQHILVNVRVYVVSLEFLELSTV